MDASRNSSGRVTPGLPTQQTTSRRLIRYGVLLLLLGLLSGLVVPMLSNPRMGLSGHLEGVMNGTLLVVLGLMWSRLRLSPMTMLVTFWLAIYGTYVNWATTLVAAAWGAGESMMPIAAMGHRGSPLQEGIIRFGLVSLAVAMLVTCVVVLWGLRGADERR
jgi:hydroxylaminobenzene mutase